MKYKIYTVEGEEKLSSIARKFNLSTQELKAHNPEMRTVGGGIFGAEYIAYGQRIKIPILSSEPVPIETNSISDVPIPLVSFPSKARYRCEQTNETRVLTSVSTYINQKTQYLLEQNLEEGYAKIELEEFLYDVIPPLLSDSFQLVKETEFIKNNALFKLSNKGKIEQIVNARQITNRWNNFKEKELKELPFIQSLNSDPEAVQNIIKAGNIEFYNPKVQEFQRNLFNFLCFDQYLYKPIEVLEKENFLYASTILEPIIIPLEFKFDKIREDEKIISFKKIAEVKLTDTLIQELKKKYEETLKPLIKYSFTEYQLMFSCTLEWNKQTQLLETASIKLKESIADNVENICDFTVERLKNYTP